MAELEKGGASECQALSVRRSGTRAATACSNWSVLACFSLIARRSLVAISVRFCASMFAEHSSITQTNQRSPNPQPTQPIILSNKRRRRMRLGSGRMMVGSESRVSQLPSMQAHSRARRSCPAATQPAIMPGDFGPQQQIMANVSITKQKQSDAKPYLR